MSGGIRSASAVSHQTENSAIPLPATTIAGSTNASGAPAANGTTAAGHSRISVIAMRIGWRGRQRNATSEPATVPAPSAARM